MEKRTEILFSTGIDTTRSDCYSKGWYEYIVYLDTLKEANVSAMELHGEDFVILIGAKWSEDSMGYNEIKVSPYELLFAYNRLLWAGLSYDEALAELLRFYEAEPFLTEAPKSLKHAEHWSKKYIIPGKAKAEYIDKNKALKLELERWLY